MEEKIQVFMQKKAVDVDDPLHRALNGIMTENKAEIDKYAEGSFHRLF